MKLYLATVFFIIPVIIAAPLPSPQAGEAPPKIPLIAGTFDIVNGLPVALGLPEIGGQVIHGFTSIVGGIFRSKRDN